MPSPEAMPALHSDALHGLAQHVMRHCPQANPLHPQAMPDLLLVRTQQPDLGSCQMYEPCVAVLVQGRKRIALGTDTLTLQAGQFLLACADVPIQSMVQQASPQNPYLAVALKLDWREIASLLLEIPPHTPHRPNCRALSAWAVSAPLLQALERLLALLDQPQHIPVLAPLIKREIFYHLLTSEAGACLRQMLTERSPAAQVARAIALLKARYTEALPVQTLAQQARMSVSTFHHQFKALTSLSPLQYQKQLRLSEARRLMLAHGMDASTAAFRVGYESASQFSREYRRLFGHPPAQDMARLREPAVADLPGAEQ